MTALGDSVKRRAKSRVASQWEYSLHRPKDGFADWFGKRAGEHPMLPKYPPTPEGEAMRRRDERDLRGGAP
jgi:hypothetical protein